MTFPWHLECAPKIASPNAFRICIQEAYIVSIHFTALAHVNTRFSRKKKSNSWWWRLYFIHRGLLFMLGTLRTNHQCVFHFLFGLHWLSLPQVPLKWRGHLMILKETTFQRLFIQCSFSNFLFWCTPHIRLWGCPPDINQPTILKPTCDIGYLVSCGMKVEWSVGNWGHGEVISTYPDLSGL